MDLIETYLRAVAAQLPRDGREDIVAELRDELQTRMEAREAELGRSLSEAEQEAVLREMGHPLTVATRFQPGPQHLVGPELYPWWLFGAKAALLAVVALSALGFFARLMLGEAGVGHAFGQATADLVGGGLTVIGLATVIGWGMERTGARPRFMTEWRVRDLGVFEMARLDPEALGVGRRAGAPADRARPARMSPAAQALASAAACAVVLLWWLGLLPVPSPDPDALARVTGPTLVDALVETLRLLRIPVAVWIGARIVFDLLRAAGGGHARLTAAGDLAFALVGLGFIAWLWTRSPLAPLIGIDGVAEWLDWAERLLATGAWTPVAALTAILSAAVLGELCRTLGALFRLITGRGSRSSVRRRGHGRQSRAGGRRWGEWPGARRALD